MLTLTNGTIKKVLIGIGVVIVLIGGGVLIYEHFHHNTSAPIQMNYADTTNPDVIKSDLAVDTNTATQITKEIQKIHDGDTTSTVTYYTPASTVQEATTKTTNAISAGDTSLPSAATEKTDRTIVTADEENQKVDVYKINLRNNHKIKAGTLLVEGDKPYVGVGYQAGRFEAMTYINADRKRATAVNYTLKEW